MFYCCGQQLETKTQKRKEGSANKQKNVRMSRGKRRIKNGKENIKSFFVLSVFLNERKKK